MPLARSTTLRVSSCSVSCDVLDLEARHLDLGADEEAERRDQLNLAAAVLVRLPVLHVDDADQLAARQHRHRQERLVAILGQLVEGLEPRVLERVAAHRHRLAMLGHPAGDALADAQLQPIDDVGVRRLRRAQHQVVVLEHVDEARVARHHGRDELHDARRARRAADRPPRCGCRSREGRRCPTCRSRQVRHPRALRRSRLP